MTGIKAARSSRLSRTLACTIGAWLSLSVSAQASPPPVAAVDTTDTSSSVGDATETPDQDTPLDSRFQVPFQMALVQSLDMGFSASRQDIRVKRVHSASQPQACTAGNGSQRGIPDFPDVQPSDRLVSADGVSISLQTFEEVVGGPTGSVALLPLFKSVDGRGEANVLSGFARIEIFHPTSLEFEPTSPDRKDEIQKWKASIAKRQQEELERKLAAVNDVAAREQEEKDRRAAEENAKLERETRERLEKEELERLGMTPHHRVGEKRGKGIEFRYEVEFPRNGPIGINWDLHTTDKTVVSYLEPKLTAFSLGIIAAKDQLIQLNDVNTTDMGPHEVVAEYVKMSPPRTLVFMCASTKKPTVANASLTHVIQNWTLAFAQPQVLSGWHVRLHLVNWSAMPELDAFGQSAEMRLVATNPFLACLPLAAETQSASAMPIMHVAYRGGCSFVEKAEHVREANGQAILVLNNVKGEGRFPPGVPLTGSVSIPVTMYVLATS